MMTRRWMTVLWAGLCFSWGQAQTPARATLDFEFSIMATERLSDFAYVQLKPAAQGKPRPVAADFDIVPLRVNSQGRSDLHRFSGPGPLRFVTTSGSGDSLAVTKVLAVVNTPASRGRSLFVLHPGVEFGTWDVIALDDEPEAFPSRQARVIHLAGEPVAVSLNGETVTLRAAPQVLPPRAFGGRLKLGVAMARQGRPVPVFDQTLSVGADERLLVVLLPPYRAGADVRTRVVRDTVAAPPAASVED